jgi:hypothetical protein
MEPITLQIRSANAAAPDYQTREKRYRQHLEARRPQPLTGLWRFFGGDFFRNGAIEGFEVDSRLRNVSLRVHCPNIIKLDRKANTCRYVHLWFRCEFRDVAFLALGTPPGAPDDAPTAADGEPLDPFDVERVLAELAKFKPRNETTFICAEIDTIGRGLDRQSPIHSLVVLTDPASRSFAVEFAECAIEAEEPDAFAEMQRNPWCFLPLYPPPD